MRLFIALTTVFLGSLSKAGGREYFYNRPQQPFSPGPPHPLQQSHIQRQVNGLYNLLANAVIQNFGLAGTAHVSRQLSTPQAPQGAISYLPPPHGSTSIPQYHTSGQSHFAHNQVPANIAGGSFASNIVASYYPQQQNLQHQQLQQQYTTSNVNPLTQYQQTSINGNFPQAQQNFANGKQQFGADSHAAQGGQSHGIKGDYISQSESGQLRPYGHQQKPVGDARPFQRQVKNCNPGECQPKNLGPGQPDQQHIENAKAARYKYENVSHKCRLIAMAKAAALNSANYPESSGVTYNANAQSVNPTEVRSNSIELIQIARPANRRHYEYSEVVLPDDPYN